MTPLGCESNVSTAMTIRLARKDDKDLVLRLLDELTLEVKKRSGKSAKVQNEEVRAKLYEEELERDDARMFVVEENGELIAMADLFLVPN